MKIVIDIPEEVLRTIRENDVGNFIYKAIKNGIPLPKGHGRLVYAEDVKQNHRRWIGYLDGDMIGRLNTAIDKYVHTIIEADKEGTE